MASMTLAEARTKVQTYLDDDGTRWSTAQIDAELAVALSACQADYAHAGGDRFDEIVESALSSGALNLSSYNPLKIKAVSLNSGNTWHSISAIDDEDTFYKPAGSETLRVRLTRSFTLPTTTSHPLVGIGATEVNNIQAFAGWVCARAAQHLKVTDDEASTALDKIELRLRETCVDHIPRNPMARDFPRKSRFIGRFYRYSYNQRSQTLTLSYDGRG